MTDREDREGLEEIRRLGRELEEQTQRQPPEVQEQMRRQAFEYYLSGVPWAIRIVAGTSTSTIVDSRGNLVEVVPSYCLRLMALDILARGGPGRQREGDLSTCLPSRRRPGQVVVSISFTADVGPDSERLRR